MQLNNYTFTDYVFIIDWHIDDVQLGVSSRRLWVSVRARGGSGWLGCARPASLRHSGSGGKPTPLTSCFGIIMFSVS